MATFESISLGGLSLAHLRQLASYVHARDNEGWYYAPKAQFEKRHADLVRWIDSAVRYAEMEKSGSVWVLVNKIYASHNKTVKSVRAKRVVSIACDCPDYVTPPES